jgi:predicted  nucleic acid-binding Zn-ribbon protein
VVDAFLRLLRLQEVDGSIREARHELVGFAPARDAAKTDAAADRAAVEAAEAQRGDQEHAHRGLESALQDADAHVVKLDAQVYEVTSRHAMETIQHELSVAKARKSDLEDQVLESLDRLDAAAAAVQRAKDAEADRAAERARAEAGRVVRESEIEAALARLAGERAGVASEVAADVLHEYDDALRKAWPPLACARSKSCPACRIVIPPQKWNEICSGQHIVRCGSCHRLLYGEIVAAGS